MKQEADLSGLTRPLVEWPLRVSYTASVLSMLVGIVVLAGWWFGFMTLVRPIPGSPAMVPDTALCFVLLGPSLFLFVRPNVHFRWRMLAQARVVVAMVLSSITLAEFATGRELGVDHLFVGNSSAAATGFGLKRSGPGSAAAFALISLAMLTLDSKRAVRNHFSEALAIGAWLVALISAAGYAYGVTALYEVTAVPDTGMSPHTVAMVLVLSAGVICARPARPLMSLVTSPRVGGLVIRRLLLGTSTIPLLGLLIMLGLRGSLYDEPFANALLAVAAMAIAVGLVLSVGRKLDRMDVARTASEQAVAEREERLRDLIQQASDGVFIADLGGRYREVNDAVCRMLGMPREEIVGKAIIDFIPWPDHPRFEVSRSGLLRGGSQMDEWTLVRRDETRLPVEVSTRILRDGRWQGLIRDISTRKQVERATDAMAEAVTGSPESSLQTVLQTIALEAKLVANAQYAAFGLGGDHVHPFES